MPGKGNPNNPGEGGGGNGGNSGPVKNQLDLNDFSYVPEGEVDPVDYAPGVYTDLDEIDLPKSLKNFKNKVVIGTDDLGTNLSDFQFVNGGSDPGAPDTDLELFLQSIRDEQGDDAVQAIAACFGIALSLGESEAGAADLLEAAGSITPGDVIAMGDGNDQMWAGDGDDIVFGEDGNDVLRGEAGDDALFGQDGNDVLDGGDGEDCLFGGEGDDELIGGAGADLLDGGGGNNTVTYKESPSTDADDQIVTDFGTFDGVLVRLTDGIGKQGDAEGDMLVDVDNVIGSDFDDLLIGDGDDNRLVGAMGDDTLVGNGGDDTLIGDGSDDDGDDTIHGGEGDDTIWGDNEDDHSDLDDAGTWSDTIFGGGGDDTIYGGDDDDTIDGGTGDDTIEGGRGADTIDGGAGDDDTASYANSTSVDSLFGINGVAVSLDVGEGLLNDAQGDTLTGIENLIGSEFDDVLQGDNGDNDISGLGGDDFIDGLGGDDHLYGGDGEDNIDGGAGDDTINGGEGIDTLIGGTGNDVIYGGTITGDNDIIFAGTADLRDFEDDVIVAAPTYAQNGTDTVWNYDESSHISVDNDDAFDFSDAFDFVSANSADWAAEMDGFLTFDQPNGEIETAGNSAEVWFKISELDDSVLFNEPEKVSVIVDNALFSNDGTGWTLVDDDITV